MKIIMSPAKEMVIDLPIQKDWKLTQDSQAIVSKLMTVTKEELQQLLKVSDALLEENWLKIQNFKEHVTYHAMDLYQGLAFRSFKQVADWTEYRDYAVKHIRILSALYGAISPEECVKPYRLDLTMNLKVEGLTLKKYWKERITTSFEKGECVINLASSEFSSLFSRKDYEWVDVDFFEKKEGVLKQHSTISKKARGKMAAWMMHHHIQDKVALQHFDIDGFTFDASLSKENYYCFVKEVS